MRRLISSDIDYDNDYLFYLYIEGSGNRVRYYAPNADDAKLPDGTVIKMTKIDD